MLTSVALLLLTIHVSAITFAIVKLSDRISELEEKVSDGNY